MRHAKAWRFVVFTWHNSIANAMPRQNNNKNNTLQMPWQSFVALIPCLFSHFANLFNDTYYLPSKV